MRALIVASPRGMSEKSPKTPAAPGTSMGDVTIIRASARKPTVSIVTPRKAA